MYLVLTITNYIKLMAEDCVFKCMLGTCPVKQKLSRSQPDGARLRNIIDASIQYGDSLHVALQRQLDANESGHCIYCGETCAVEKACKNPNRWVPAYLISGDRGGHKGSGREGQTCNEQGSNPKAV